MWLPPFRKLRKSAEIAANERFLFCAGPALHLPLGGNGIGDPVKPLENTSVTGRRCAV
jgi:hypothetical protein